ncbi:hypothetical protein Tsubulata_001894 [Turnera subulata]|uniref:Cytochrome P450 n=1 Tax=Turnera subulata TaxID=218843 RepID=A0A9Q0J0E4_9ROSI|nr:hypothetical protein Tsubulata_001894 [Turnera subulata]
MLHQHVPMLGLCPHSLVSQNIQHKELDNNWSSCISYSSIRCIFVSSSLLIYYQDMDTLTIGLCAVALVVVYCTHLLLVSKWKNPKVNGVLPPGSLGLPLIGETLQFIIPSPSLDLHPFVKKRMQKYGPIFKTRLVGRPIIICTDPEVIKYVLTQEGKLVEIWYLDSFAKFFAHEGENRLNAIGKVHSYVRSITLNHFGVDRLRESLLPKVEDMIHAHLIKWSTQGPVDVKHHVSVMVFNFTAKQIFGYDVETTKEKLSENYTKILNSLISFPINIPGTAFRKCMQDQAKMIKILKDTLMERLSSPEKRRGDFLDQAIDDMESQKFLTVDFIPQLIFGILFASFESMSTTLTLTIKFLSEYPQVVEELRAEHEAIKRRRKNPDSPLTWEEHRSMEFTHMVVKETLRIQNVAPGLFRKALKDFEVKGYTVPAGWTLMLVTPAVQLNPETFEDPVTFNPWRWKELDQVTVSKNFMPFGGGTRQCAGAEYSKMVLATFLHILVTKYNFTKVKGGNVLRTPIVSFGDGIHIKFSPRVN